MKTLVALAVAATLIATPAVGEKIDRSLLRGRWVELLGDEKPDCSDALPFEHELNADGTILMIRVILKWLLSELSGPRVSEESLRVGQTVRNALVLVRDGAPKPGVPAEWQITVVPPQTCTSCARRVGRLKRVTL